MLNFLHGLLKIAFAVLVTVAIVMLLALMIGSPNFWISIIGKILFTITILMCIGFLFTLIHTSK